MDDTSEAAAAPVELGMDIMFAILSHFDPLELVAARLVGKAWRELCDVLLEEKFVERFSLASVALQPPTPVHYAAAAPCHFALCHKLKKGETLAMLALRYQTMPSELKRLNMLLSDATLASRDALFVPLARAAEQEAAGKRAAFVHDPASKRRFVVLLDEGEALPGGLRAAPAERSEAAAARAAGVLARACGIGECEARFYLSQSNGDVREAIAACNRDARWARVMRRRAVGPGLLGCRLLSLRL